MITRDNIKAVVDQLSDKDKKRIRNNWRYEYCVLYLHVFNAGSATTMRLTNDFNRYKNVSSYGDVILEVKDVCNILNS